MSKHTQGPWKVYEANRDTMHIGTVSTEPDAGWKYETICHLYEDVADNYDTNNEFKLFDNAEANALLIAAAPDLLAALQSMLEGNHNQQDVREAARAAIAKATGTD